MYVGGRDSPWILHMDLQFPENLVPSFALHICQCSSTQSRATIAKIPQIAAMFTPLECQTRKIAGECLLGLPTHQSRLIAPDQSLATISLRLMGPAEFSGIDARSGGSTVTAKRNPAAQSLANIAISSLFVPQVLL